MLLLCTQPRIIVVCVILFTSLLACKPKQAELTNAASATLSIEDQNTLLEKLYAADQAPRERLDHVKNGSAEMNQIMAEMAQIDASNYIAVSTYLRDHGYPDTENFSENAQIAPWIILHHSDNPELRLNNVKYLQEGHQNGALSAGRFWGYLSRTYQKKFHERAAIDTERRWSTKERIPSLLTLLRLHSATKKTAECSESEDFEQILIKALAHQNIKDLYIRTDSSSIEMIFDLKTPSEPQIELYGKNFKYQNLKALGNPNPKDLIKKSNELYIHCTRSEEMARLAVVSLFHNKSYLMDFKSHGCYWQILNVAEVKL